MPEVGHATKIRLCFFKEEGEDMDMADVDKVFLDCVIIKRVFTETKSQQLASRIKFSCNR